MNINDKLVQSMIRAAFSSLKETLPKDNDDNNFGWQKCLYVNHEDNKTS